MKYDLTNEQEQMAHCYVVLSAVREIFDAQPPNIIRAALQRLTWDIRGLSAETTEWYGKLAKLMLDRSAD